mmetsp:Transcript_26072/g.42744  ORF Transcript_26072/g.42744 Transcript_26072/m.42744 type:complete len:323 (+) Transcript_26072:19-987(+)
MAAPPSTAALPLANIPEEDRSFKDNGWLQAFPLNVHSVMDYFSLSMFYDRTCNNEYIKMQRLDPKMLTSMRGIEYVLFHKNEPLLFVIHKQQRDSPTQFHVLATYYVLGGTVYRAPNLQAVFSTRLVSCLHFTSNALKNIAERSRFNPACGHYWDFAPPADALAAFKSNQSKLQMRQQLRAGPLSYLRKLEEDLLQAEKEKAAKLAQQASGNNPSPIPSPTPLAADTAQTSTTSASSGASVKTSGSQSSTSGAVQPQTVPVQSQPSVQVTAAASAGAAKGRGSASSGMPPQAPASKKRSLPPSPTGLAATVKEEFSKKRSRN